MGRIERPPSWILKYKERIEQGTMTVEEILEEENKIRDVPIKISSVTRAINAMGHPITGMRRGEGVEVREGEAKRNVETDEKKEKIERGPGWLQKYHDRIEKGTITVEEILDEENKIRETPIKITTVKRAINAMGYPISEMRSERGGEAKGTPETGGEPQKVEKGPGWLQKYRDRIKKGTITIGEILEAENKIRDVPIKRSSVTRAVNAMGYPISEMRSERRKEVKGVEKVKKAGEAEAVVYSSSIGKISAATVKRFNMMKKNWEGDLGKPLYNDYFVNILLALAKLAGHGRSLAPVKR
jgi:DNA-binding FrmR family transcriptional regulator